MTDRNGIHGLEGLSESVARHMKSKGIERATDPQKLSFQPITDGKDLLLIAPTGFGKTEAAFAPLLQKRHESEGKGFKLLYIAPLRALNRDILRRIEAWCEDLDLTIGVRHSDTTQSERNRQARKPPDVLVTTPETLQIMFTGSRLRKGLSNVEHVILDEIHELYGDERGAQLDVALARLDRLTGRKVQRVGLSATVQDPDEVGCYLTGSRPDPVLIRGDWSKEFSFIVDSPTETADDKEWSKKLGCSVKIASAIREIREISYRESSVLLFVNSRDLAEALTTRLRAYDPELKVGIHHGSLSREARIEMEDQFKSGDLSLLICTSSMELGMDIGAVDLVIQFKSPKEVSRLIQRGGRAGHRIGDVSRCIVLATQPDDVLEAGVIAYMALKGKLETRNAKKGALSVLANQALSMASAEKEYHVSELFDMLKDTYTFSGLSTEELMEVLNFLHSSRLLFLEDDHVKGGRRTREYFYDNISMIPDQRVMRIKDLSTRKVIGSLDMDFVLSNLEPFSKFVVRGQPWRVIDIGEEEITVQPVTDLGPVPAWSGSDIPVPWEVAQEVGKVRASLIEWLSGDSDDEGMLKELPLTDAARKTVVDMMREQIDEGFDTPDHTKITIEIGKEGIVIGNCGGTRVNETVGRVLAALLSARYGGNVVVDYDPYRIMLTGDLRIRAPDIEWAFTHAPADDLETMIPILLKNSPLLRWQMIHVAKKFGVLKGDIDPKKFPLRRLMGRWKESPIMAEASRKIMHERLDMPHSRDVINSVVDGSSDLVIQKISPLSMSGSRMRGEFMTPETAGSDVLDSVRERLNTKAFRMTCMNCGSTLRGTAERAKGIVGCHKCGSRMLSPIPPGDIKTRKAVEKGVKKKRLNQDETKRFRAASTAAQLFASYGYRAVLALAGRGVGPQTAARLLEVPYKDDFELVKRIFGEEVKYERTRRFWD